MTAEKKKTTDVEETAAAAGADEASPKKAATKRAAAQQSKPAAKKAKAEAETQPEPSAPTEAKAKPSRRGSKSGGRKTAAGKIRITQVRSQIGFARAQRKVLAGLGLGRIGRSVVRNDDACIRGMVAKVSHLVAVEEVEA